MLIPQTDLELEKISFKGAFKTSSRFTKH